MSALLEVENLKAEFPLPNGKIQALNGVSFQIDRGEIIGLAGESGSGKSVTTQCLLGMLPPPGRITDGDIRFDGESLLGLTERQFRQIRGRRISIVVQDALAALNPVIPTGEQVADVLLAHTDITRKSAWERVVEIFGQVGIPAARERSHRYAHEFSGGMQQRVVIGAAVACGPELIIADEPTTALDVTVQMQVLALLLDVRKRLGSAVLYISHDLAAVARICDRVLIMYAGEIVEQGPVREVFANPKHPYTQGLLASIPPISGQSNEFLTAIPGMPPNPAALPPGCRFAPRCPYVMDACREARPDLITVGTDHAARCILPLVRGGA
jgi:oligopeptide/dipeptide ABC transporter ATP-binding protein